MSVLRRALCGGPDKYDLSVIDVGRSGKAEVMKRLGRPKSIAMISSVGHVSEEWTWGGPFRTFMTVEFDSTGIVKRKCIKIYS